MATHYLITNRQLRTGDGCKEYLRVNEKDYIRIDGQEEAMVNLRLVKDGDTLRGTWRAMGVEDRSGTLSYVVRPWCCDKIHLDGSRTEHCVASDQIKEQQANGCRGFKPR